jgi:hypothetical protein
MEWFVADTITKIYVANQTSDGKWNVLVLPSDFDFSGAFRQAVSGMKPEPKPPPKSPD